MQVRTSGAIGAAIRSRRRELNLDQERLAERIGATRQWVIGIEKGKDTAEIGMVLRALAALDLEIDLRPTLIPSAIPPPLEPLPTVDIDAIVDSVSPAGSGKKATGTAAKSGKQTKPRKGNRRG